MIKYKMRRKGIVYGEYFNCGRQKNMQDIIAEYMRKGGLVLRRTTVSTL